MKIRGRAEDEDEGKEKRIKMMGRVEGEEEGKRRG